MNVTMLFGQRAGYYLCINGLQATTSKILNLQISACSMQQNMLEGQQSQKFRGHLKHHDK